MAFGKQPLACLCPGFMSGISRNKRLQFMGIPLGAACHYDDEDGLQWPPLTIEKNPLILTNYSIMVPCHVGIHLLQGPRTSLIAWHWRFQPFLHLGRGGSEKHELEKSLGWILLKKNAAIIPGFFWGGRGVVQSIYSKINLSDSRDRDHSTHLQISKHPKSFVDSSAPFFSDPFCWVKRDRE